jgi:molecular chaperone DnaK (HSP70)
VDYEVVRNSNGSFKINCPGLNKQFAPEEISAQVLRKLADDASSYLGQKVTQAVVTVFAYFVVTHTKILGKRCLNPQRISHEIVSSLSAQSSAVILN